MELDKLEAKLQNETQQKIDTVTQFAADIRDALDHNLTVHDHDALYALLDHLHTGEPVPDPDPDPIPDPDPDPDPIPDPEPPGPGPAPGPAPSGAHVDPTTYLVLPAGGRQLTGTPSDNLKDLASSAQPNDQITLAPGVYPGGGDILFKVPVQIRVQGFQPGDPVSKMAQFINKGGAKGVMVVENGQDLGGGGLEASDAVCLFDGLYMKDVGLPGGSNDNFSGFRLSKGNHIVQNCVIEGGREGVLGQLYRGHWQNQVKADDPTTGQDIVLKNCKILDCGKGGLSHGVYTRTRRFWIEDCQIWNDPATAPYGANPGFHDVKHLGSILDIHNSQIGHANSNVAVPVDVSGHAGAVRITGSHIIKGKWLNATRNNRNFFNYLWQRLGDNAAPDTFVVDNCILETFFVDPGSAIPRTVFMNYSGTLNQNVTVTNSTIKNSAPGTVFRLSSVPQVNNSTNTIVGNVSF